MISLAYIILSTYHSIYVSTYNTFETHITAWAIGFYHFLAQFKHSCFALVKDAFCKVGGAANIQIDRKLLQYVKNAHSKSKDEERKKQEEEEQLNKIKQSQLKENEERVKAEQLQTQKQ